MTIAKVGRIHFNTHITHISRNELSGRLYVFKHNKERCELDSFDEHDETSDEFITEPLATLWYSASEEEL